MELLRNAIVKLRAGGVRVALDDFGTGYSSVGLVKNLPFDTIKIDRSFVLRIEEDEKERSLIQTFSTMASTFGAKVCVEGIETAGMRDILQQFNIQSFQGYYYGKPLELREFLVRQPYASEGSKQ
jgi:EAL domain-containing protein (putative c-di-GMP-specific phosphodiesterase class I)